MLKKCFKYDFKSVFKIWWIAGVTVLAISVVAGFAIKNIYLHSEDPDRIFIFETVAIVFYYFSLFAIGILTSVLLCIRFYSNFFSDEGYLTFTLPVKRTTLFLSKILNGFLFQLMSVATVIVSLIIISLIVPSTSNNYTTVFGEVVGNFIALLKELNRSDIVWLTTYIVEIILLVALLELSGILLLYMLITLGSVVVKKFKVAATVGFLVGANYVLSALLIPAILAFVLWNDAASHLYGEFFMEPYVAVILFFCSVVLGTASALFANVTQGCIERKLNLS